MSNSTSPQIGIIMGSTSDWPTMGKAAEVLQEFGVPFESEVGQRQVSPIPIELLRPQRRRPIPALVRHVPTLPTTEGTPAVDPRIPRRRSTRSAERDRPIELLEIVIAVDEAVSVLLTPTQLPDA